MNNQNKLFRAIGTHCKILLDSHHFDAVIDYVLMAWNYVRGLPVWDEPSHNQVKKDCFKVLSLHARAAVRTGGMSLGSERVTHFRNKLKSMSSDYEEISKCHEALNFLANN